MLSQSVRQSEMSSEPMERTNVRKYSEIAKKRKAIRQRIIESHLISFNMQPANLLHFEFDLLNSEFNLKTILIKQKNEK